MMPETVALILVMLYAFAGLAVLFLGGRLIRYDLARGGADGRNLPRKHSRLVEDLRPFQNLVVEFFARSAYFSRLLNVLARQEKSRSVRRSSGISVRHIAWPAASLMAVAGLVQFRRRGLVLTEIGREVVQRIIGKSPSVDAENPNGGPPHRAPADVIAMSTRAELLDLDTKERMEFTLVPPGDADIESGKLSVAAPLGAAMLGHRVGDEFEWTIPYGKRRLKVVAVDFRPEAALALAA